MIRVVVEGGCHSSGGARGSSLWHAATRSAVAHDNTTVLLMVSSSSVEQDPHKPANAGIARRITPGEETEPSLRARGVVLCSGTGGWTAGEMGVPDGTEEVRSQVRGGSRDGSRAAVSTAFDQRVCIQVNLLPNNRQRKCAERTIADHGQRAVGTSWPQAWHWLRNRHSRVPLHRVRNQPVSQDTARVGGSEEIPEPPRGGAGHREPSLPCAGEIARLLAPTRPPRHEALSAR